MNRYATATAALVLAVLMLAPAARAARSKDLWATVNICDTKRHPDKLGVRARMPGDGTRERMYMRFSVQYRHGGRWQAVKGALSHWLYAGSARFRNEELGYTFPIDPPPTGHSYLMRGMVQFQWRKHVHRHWRIVHRTHLHTEGGHRSQGADPKRYSAATCRIR